MIELLVVTVLLTILLVIALPMFLGQKGKGQDAAAKANARNALTQVEACFASERDYRKCVTPGVLSGTGIPTTGPNAVSVTGSETTYRVVAASRSEDGAQSFVIEKDAGGSLARTCALADRGGCSSETDASGNRW